MGLIRTLIADHRAKQQEDFDTHFDHLTKLASLPGIDDETRQKVNDNIGIMLGQATGVPKQHHGVLGKLIGGFASHLAGLNPNPKDEWNNKLEPISIVEPRTEGLANAVVPGQRLPGAPEFHHNTEANARRFRAQQAQEQRQTTAADTAAEYEQKQVAIRSRVADLKKALDGGQISTDQYKQAVAELISGVKITQPNLGRTGLQGSHRIIALSNDGTPTPTSAYLGFDENGGRIWFDEKTREPIEPERIVDTNPPKETAEPMQLRLLTEAYRALSDPNTPQDRRQAAAQIIKKSQADLATKQAAYQRSTQQIAEEGYLSGMYGQTAPSTATSTQPSVAPSTSRTASPTASPTARPQPTSQAPPQAPVRANGPGQAAGQGGQATGQGSGQATAIPPKQSPGNTGGVDSTATNALPGKVNVAQASKDKDVQFWLNDIELRAAGIANRSAAGRGSQVSLKRGQEKFYALTGLDPSVVATNLTEKIGLRDAIKKNTDALSAFDRLGSRLQNMGALLKGAASKMDPGSPAWNKFIYNIRNNVTGDPNTRVYLLALTEFKKEYAQVISNGYMSVAQTPIGAAEEVNGKIADSIEQRSLPDVLNLVDKARVMNTQSFVDQQQKLFHAAASPMGTESAMADIYQKTLTLPKESKDETNAEPIADLEWKNGKLIPMKKGK